MKIITLEEYQFNKYAENHKYRSYYQSSAYGKIMKKFGYDIHYLGIIDENENIIGASLLLYKEVFMNYKIAYAPRGLLFDYSNGALLKEFTERLKKLLSKQGFMLLKIDPVIPVSLHNANGKILNINPESNIIVENLKASHWEYHGPTLFFETEKPRFEAVISLDKDINTIYDNFEKRVRYKIKKAIRSGVEIIKGNEQNIPLFYEFVKKKYARPIEYYQEFFKQFKGNVDLYFAKLNTETFVINSKKLYEKEMEINDNLAYKIQQAKNDNARKKLINEKIESDKLINTYKKNLVWATKLLKENPNGILISSSFILRYDHAAFLIIEGLNSKFKSLNPSYLMKWELISKYKNMNLKYINFNAVSGDFEHITEYSGLNEMKLGFNPIISEYVGEFDFVINQLPYNLYRNLNKDKKKAN